MKQTFFFLSFITTCWNQPLVAKEAPCSLATPSTVTPTAPYPMMNSEDAKALDIALDDLDNNFLTSSNLTHQSTSQTMHLNSINSKLPAISSSPTTTERTSAQEGMLEEHAVVQVGKKNSSSAVTTNFSKTNFDEVHESISAIQKTTDPILQKKEWNSIALACTEIKDQQMTWLNSSASRVIPNEKRADFFYVVEALKESAKEAEKPKPRMDMMMGLLQAAKLTENSIIAYEEKHLEKAHCLEQAGIACMRAVNALYGEKKRSSLSSQSYFTDSLAQSESFLDTFTQDKKTSLPKSNKLQTIPRQEQIAFCWKKCSDSYYCAAKALEESKKFSEATESNLDDEVMSKAEKAADRIEFLTTYIDNAPDGEDTEYCLIELNNTLNELKDHVELAEAFTENPSSMQLVISKKENDPLTKEEQAKIQRFSKAATYFASSGNAYWVVATNLSEDKKLNTLTLKAAELYYAAAEVLLLEHQANRASCLNQAAVLIEQAVTESKKPMSNKKLIQDYLNQVALLEKEAEKLKESKPSESKSDKPNCTVS